MYVELHCHSAFSFLDGASTPQELAGRAAELGYAALALTDHDGVWGAMEHAVACRGAGVRPIVGAELTVSDPSPATGAFASFHVTVLAGSRTGWTNLCRLITEAHRETRPSPGREPLPPSVTLEQLERYAGGLVCMSGCAGNGALAAPLGGARPSPGSRRLAEQRARRLLAAFGHDRFRIELQRPFWRRDRARNRRLAELGELLGARCVATGNVHSHNRARARLQDALVAIRHGTSLEESEALRRGNTSSALVPPEAMAERFSEHPEAVAEAARLAERLQFDLAEDLGYAYPGAEDPTADRRLAELCGDRLRERYRGRRSRREAESRLATELGVIRGLGLSGFFCLHHDLLELAREVACEVRGPNSARAMLPPGRGRGSSVSSIVCYLTGLSHVDPVETELFLGRFLNEEITDLPDIDLDFPRDVREALIPRIHERYGHDRSALVAAFPTYRSRGAIRELGKALGLPQGEIEQVARMADPFDAADPYPTEALGPRRARSGRWQVLARLASEMYGLPRHPSQHPGGMVLSTRPLTELCPIQPAAMEGRRVVQWDKDSCADAGFLKIDLLGLGMLSAVERCVEEIARARGERIDLSRIPLDDTEVYRQIRAAETAGVFQVESRAQMQMLPRSRPETISDLAVQVALVRPGPIQGGAVHPYLERRRRLRAEPGFRIPYEHPALEPILRDTLGAIVFQDQVIQIAMALAGFGAGEAEGLRRAMSRKRSEAAILSYRRRFVEGAIERGVSRGIAERVFAQIEGFSGFGFPKSHAVAFALLAYQSAWLRVHYGPELLCSLLNEQPMGFYPPDALVHEAQRRGIEVLPVDVNRSRVPCSVEETKAVPPGPLGRPQPAVRIGLAYVDGVRGDEMEGLVRERERGGPYRDHGELASRSGVGRDGLERLAWAGACEGLGGGPGTERREDLWRLGIAAGAHRLGGTGEAPEQLSLPLPLPSAPRLPAMGGWERIVADYSSTGLTLDVHPMELVRESLGRDVRESFELRSLPEGTRLELAGLVVARQRPATARGVVFMLLEDEHGMANVVVPPGVYDRCRSAVRTASFALAAGRLERGDGSINVLAERIEALERPDLALAEVRHIEPEPDRETGRGPDRDTDPGRARRAAAGLRDAAAAAPRPHSFGRRDR